MLQFAREWREVVSCKLQLLQHFTTPFGKNSLYITEKSHAKFQNCAKQVLLLPIHLYIGTYIMLTWQVGKIAYLEQMSTDKRTVSNITTDFSLNWAHKK